jgi:flagellar protein FliJ
MKSFKFEMEQILRMKKWREEAAKKALAIEVQALEMLKAKLKELENDRQEVLESGLSQVETEIDYRGRLGIIQYARFMGTQIEGQEGDIATQGERLKEKSDLLLKAMQERKVLEKLRERKVKEYRVLRNRHEYANLDESSSAFLRRAVARDNSLEGIEDS